MLLQDHFHIVHYFLLVMVKFTHALFAGLPSMIVSTYQDNKKATCWKLDPCIVVQINQSSWHVKLGKVKMLILTSKNGGGLFPYFSFRDLGLRMLAHSQGHAFPAMTSQHLCCKKGMWCASFGHLNSLTFCPQWLILYPHFMARSFCNCL